MKTNQVERCDFRIHDIIDGKYQVVLLLGSTDTDQQFKVIESNGNEYILKLLKLWNVPPRLRDDIILSADNEINSCCIKSNYLTRIVKKGMVAGNPYLLIEYYRSVSLLHKIGRKDLDIVRTSKEILYGLRDLHKSGKTHCNLIPDSILLSNNGHILLTNYVVLGERGKTVLNVRMQAGDRYRQAYKAPELYRTERCATVLPTLDIFSFGVILYQMLSGKLPFGNCDTEVGLVEYQTRAKSNDWDRNIILHLPSGEMWCNVLEMCLCADPSARVQNVDDILSKLPQDDNNYVGIENSDVEANKIIHNGIQLRVMQGNEFGKTYRLPEIMQLPKRIITVGRADNTIFNMIQIHGYASSYISRRHCTLEYDDENETWYIRDGQWNKESKDNWTNSLNGTFVNSRRVDSEGLNIEPGDIISIGDLRLRVEGY